MFKVHCLNKISKVGTSCLSDNYITTETIEAADAILVRSAAMHDMEFSKNLKAIARAGAGVNNIPLDKCAQQGIVVFNTPGANANGVKELVLAGLLLAARDVVGGIDWVKENKELPDLAKQVEKAKSAYAGYEIKGKKLGVIGLGAIGVEVANAATALGMEVYGYDPYISVANAWKLSQYVKNVKSLGEIYSECDYITVHVPLMDSTKGMINKDTMAMMKDGVKILNFSRDALVNDTDMAAALESGKVAK
ncbi:MAG: 3-phosphoglycerate dehydrogenase, partial [Lachnospiraceae bacterium]|nr:3-phosphoglycerate dehydrogenase [Lachnospiraceae bacterium]